MAFVTLLGLFLIRSATPRPAPLSKTNSYHQVKPLSVLKRFIDSLLLAPGLRCWTQPSSSCGAGALGPWASVLVARGLSSYDDWA